MISWATAGISPGRFSIISRIKLCNSRANAASQSGWYHEDGQLILQHSPPLASSRRYRWHPGVAGGIDVFFEDDRFFHNIDLTQSAPAAHHFCPPDDYHVAYDFASWPDWTAHWQVSGPRKSYDMRSCYRKTQR